MGLYFVDLATDHPEPAFAQAEVGHHRSPYPRDARAPRGTLLTQEIEN
jgi:hypothetical protein